MTTTPTTIGDAVAKRDNGPGALVASYTADFATVLPSHIKPETWVRLAQGALRRNPVLAKAAEQNPGSLLTALLEAARLGLTPGTEEFYLVPYGREVTGITGYQGEIELIYRAGAVSSVKAEIVHERDTFRYDPATMERPEHLVDWWGDRGAMLGVYAYAVMTDGGTSRVIVMSAKDIDRVKAVAKGADRADSPWRMWPDRMWLKSAIHQLAKWVPTSAEYRREQLRAAVEADKLRDVAPVPVRHVDDIADALIVDEETGEVSS